MIPFKCSEIPLSTLPNTDSAAHFITPYSLCRRACVVQGSPGAESICLGGVFDLCASFLLWLAKAAFWQDHWTGFATVVMTVRYAVTQHSRGNKHVFKMPLSRYRPEFQVGEKSNFNRDSEFLQFEKLTWNLTLGMILLRLSGLRYEEAAGSVPPIFTLISWYLT